MTNVEIIRDYFERYFSGRADYSEVRSFITDDFSLTDPLGSAKSAEEYVGMLSALPDDFEMYAEIRDIIGQGGKVAALVDFQTPGGVVNYACWFDLEDGRIRRWESIYDPRLFLEARGPEPDSAAGSGPDAQD